MRLSWILQIVVYVVLGIGAHSTMALMFYSGDCNSGSTGVVLSGDDNLECTGVCDPQSPCEKKQVTIDGTTYVWCDCDDWTPDDPLEIGCAPILVQQAGQEDFAKCNVASSCPGQTDCTKSPIPLVGEFTCYCPPE